MIRKTVFNPLITLFALYLLSYGLMLVNAGVWWDDWCLYNMSIEGIKELFVGAGGVHLIPVHLFLQNASSSPPILYHSLTFILYFICIIALYYILPYLKVNGDNRFILSALFAVLPINFARIFMCCIHYTIGIFFCFVGIYFFTISFYKKQVQHRLISLICCVFSYVLLQSTFIFIPAYIAFVFAINNIDINTSIIKNMRRIISQTLKYIDFVIVTLAVWIVLSVFEKPTGLYAMENYNSILIGHVLASPVNLFLSFADSFIRMFNFRNGRFMICVFVFVLFLLLFIFRNKKMSFHFDNPIISIMFLKKHLRISIFVLSGLYFFIAGALAYVFVGKTPMSYGFKTRHQALLGIGISLILLGLLVICIRKKYIKYVFIFLLTFCITANIDRYLIMQGFYYKNLALMAGMAKKEEIVNNRNFIMIDNVSINDFNFTSFYEYQGMAKKVFGDETRFIITEYDFYTLVSAYQNIDVLKMSMYNMKDITYSGSFDYYIIVNFGEIFFSPSDIIKLILKEYLFREKFSQDIDKILKIDCLPYQND